ncbi:MAG: hypothetical protein BWY19_01199 [bacterium ADurb.Bin212]|nr:MAG: hypothetical protein BWY19_01199 [bacterium ADurb.Bin212]
MWAIMNKTLNLVDLKIILATREFANFAVQSALSQKCNQISLIEVDSISRSFLDELYLLSSKNNINLVDIPEDVQPLLELIKRSHRDQVMYAPKIKVRISDKTFA